MIEVIRVSVCEVARNLEWSGVIGALEPVVGVGEREVKEAVGDALSSSAGLPRRINSPIVQSQPNEPGVGACNDSGTVVVSILRLLSSDASASNAFSTMKRRVLLY